MPDQNSRKNVYHYEQLYPTVPLECKLCGNLDGQCPATGTGPAHSLQHVHAAENSYRERETGSGSDADKVRSRQI